MDEPIKVNKQQELFCREYLKDLNGSRAARRAGYSEKTSGQIGWQFLNLPEHISVQERIGQLLKQRAEECKVDSDYILQKLKMIAEAKIEDFVELVTSEYPNPAFEMYQTLIHEELKAWEAKQDQLTDEDISDGVIRESFKPSVDLSQVPRTLRRQELKWKDFSDLPPEQRGAVQMIKEGRNGIEIKLFDKAWSLDMIAKHIGFYEKDNSQKTPEGPNIYLPENGR